MTERRTKAAGILVLFATIILVTVMVTGCSVQVGWIGPSAEGSATARFVLFTGKKTKLVKAQTGDTISVEHNSEITSGSLSIALVAPDGTITELPTNTKGRRSFILDQEGQYRIVIEGKNAGGNYAVAWTRIRG